MKVAYTLFSRVGVAILRAVIGGQLRVSHNSHPAFLDWSNTDSMAIELTAFYSDCEHEVLQVETGCWITLTYNLYVPEHVGSVLQRRPVTLAPFTFALL